MMMQNRRTSFLFGENVPYIEQLYESYLDDADSVSQEWREYFAALQSAPAVDGSSRADVAHAAIIDRFVELSKRARPAPAMNESLALAKKQVAVQSLVAAYRMLGTRQALLDPLNWSPVPPLPELTPAYYGLAQSDLATHFSTADTYFWDAGSASLQDIITALDETYCGTLGAEYTHLADASQRQWWQMRLESARAKPTLTNKHHRTPTQLLLRRLRQPPSIPRPHTSNSTNPIGCLVARSSRRECPSPIPVALDRGEGER